MRKLIGCTLAVLALCVSLSADDKKDEKIDPAKLVGLWEDTDSKKDAKDRIRFTKDKTVEIIAILGGKGAAATGTYKIEGKKLVIAVGGKDSVRVLTIDKLTDEDLSLVDDKKKTKTYKKLKDE